MSHLFLNFVILMVSIKKYIQIPIKQFYVLNTKSLYILKLCIFQIIIFEKFVSTKIFSSSCINYINRYLSIINFIIEQTGSLIIMLALFYALKNLMFHCFGSVILELFKFHIYVKLLIKINFILLQ